MPFLDKLPDSAQVVVGVLFMLLGCSFLYKAFLAMIKGKLTYWEGFLPLTIVSPFFMHLPTGKNSLAKSTEALWVHMLMGPVFLFTSILFLAAGADLANLPGTKTLNTVVTCGNGTQAIWFDKRDGYHFPILLKAAPVFAGLFGKNVNLEKNQELVPHNGSYHDAVGGN